jgi:hypothetical protein
LLVERRAKVFARLLENQASIQGRYLSPVR